MNGIAVLVSLAAVGVDYGWQPAGDGQLEYIVQIEPALVERLKNGDEIASEIPPEARGVRRFRIRVGTGPVPRIGHLDSSTSPRKDPASGSSTTGGGSLVLPPTPTDGISSGGTAGNGFGATLGSGRGPDFGPNGFLRLPPPPPLLGVDGKSSVLVRPGEALTDGTGAGRGSAGGVLPPERGTAPSVGIGAPANEVLPPAAGGASGVMDVDSPAEPPRGTIGGGILPPVFHGNSSFPTLENPADSASGVREVLPPDSDTNVRPIPGLPGNGNRPQPIPGFGHSGIRPPASSEATLGPHGPTSTPPPVAGDTPRQETTDLLAQQDPLDAALQKPTIDEQTAEQLTPKPWTPLVLTSLALFASLAANLYLGWVAGGIYHRYRDVVAQLHQAQTSLA